MDALNTTLLPGVKRAFSCPADVTLKTPNLGVDLWAWSKNMGFKLGLRTTFNKCLFCKILINSIWKKFHSQIPLGKQIKQILISAISFLKDLNVFINVHRGSLGRLPSHAGPSKWFGPRKLVIAERSVGLTVYGTHWETFWSKMKCRILGGVRSVFGQKDPYEIDFRSSQHLIVLTVLGTNESSLGGWK